MNVESIAEVKILTSTYQAEYGRSSGVQVTAVTKSGTNQFRGSLYGVERNSEWNSNSKVNKLQRGLQDDPRGAGLGLPSAARSESPGATTNCSSSTRRSSRRARAAAT